MAADDEERSMFAAVVERFAARPDAAWPDIGDAGLLGLTLADERGGQGAGPHELVATGTALGRHLSAAGYLGSAVLVGELLAAAASDTGPTSALTTWLSGQQRWTTLLDATGPLLPPASDVSARSGSTVRVSTEEAVVVDLSSDAALLVVTLAPTPLLLAVEPDAGGVVASETPAGDPTRPISRLRLTDAPATVLAEGEEVAQALDRVRREAWLYLAAESLGAAEHCLDRMVDFAGTRTTFGRKIGSYQAIKHLCVDRWIEVESARALLDLAVDEATDEAIEGASGEPTTLHLAVAAATEALHRAARDQVLVHGAMGFTQEHPAHRYLRRARAAQVIGGVPAWHRRQAARQLQAAYAGG